MTRILSAVTLWLCFCGCLPFVPVPYACPTISYTPPVHIETPDEVHVFRVDMRKDLSCPEFNRGDRYALCEVGLSPGGWIFPQGQMSTDYGFVWNCIALIYDKHVHHT